MANELDDFSRVVSSGDHLMPGTLELAVAVLRKRWKPGILWLLRRGTLRFRDFESGLGNVSAKVLTQQLRELERDGLIHRMVSTVGRGRAVYSATEAGRQLAHILDELTSWGAKYHRHFPTTAARYGLAGVLADRDSDASQGLVDASLTLRLRSAPPAHVDNGSAW